MYEQALPETRVFGAVILEQRKVMERLVGRDTFERALTELPSEQADEYRRLSLLGWCRASTAAAVTTQVARQSGRQPEAFMAEVVREGFGAVLSGIWRFFMRFSSDEAIVRRAATLYAKACDRGKMQARQLGPGDIELRLSEWPDVGNLDLVAISTGIETALSLVGRKELRVTWRRDAGGAKFSIRQSQVHAALSAEK